MRDRNHLNLQQFHIQLKKAVLCREFYSKIQEKEEYFSHKSCLWSSDPKLFVNSRFLLVLPRDFRLTRSLVISHWYFPENFRFLVNQTLSEQSFSHFNEKQKLEISILLSSREICEKYLFLTERYTGNEIFGNILGNDLKDLFLRLKLIFVKQRKARKKMFRRGPKDKGTRRSDSSLRILEEEIRKDVFLKLEDEKVKKKMKLRTQTSQTILLILENFSEEGES